MLNTRRFEAFIQNSKAFIQQSLINNSLNIMGVNAIGMMVGLILWIFTTHLYIPTDVGIASSTISIIQLISGVAGLGLGLGLVRYLSNSQNPNAMLNTALSSVILSSSIAGSIFLMGTDYWTPTLSVIKEKWIYFIGFLALVIFTSISSLFQLTFIACRQAKYSFWQFSIINLTRLLLTILFIRAGSLGIIAAVGISTAIGCSLGIFYFAPRVISQYRFRIQLSFEISRYLFPYSIVSYFADLLYRTPVLVMPVLALEKLGPEYSSYAYIGWMIGWLLTSPGQSLASAAFAEGSFSPSKIYLLIVKSVKKIFFLALLLAIFTFLFSDLILGIFGKSYAIGASGLVRILALSSPIVAVNSLIFSLLRVRNKLLELTILSGITATVALMFASLFLVEMGLLAGGIGWLISQSIIFMILIRHLSRSK